MAQSSSANTFGTFLETSRQLESTPSRTTAGDGWESEALSVAKSLLHAPAPRPVKEVMAETGLSQDAFLRAMTIGQERALFVLSEPAGVPSLELTSLGRAIAG